jgi:hypothetical protein
MVFLNTDGDTTYNIPDNGNVIQVSGSHLIHDTFDANMNRRWKQVRDATLARKSRNAPPVWYSISTSTNTIQIGSILFRDYEEISNSPSISFLVSLLQLQHLNPNIANNAVYAFSSPHLDNGLSEHTLVKMVSGDWKPLSEIQLGDYIADPYHNVPRQTTWNINDIDNHSRHTNQVTGVIDLHSHCYTKYIWNGILCTGNSKVYEPTLEAWMNVEVSLSAKRVERRNEVELNRRIALPLSSDNAREQGSSDTHEHSKTTVLTETPYGYRNILTSTGVFIIYDPLLNCEVVWLDFEQVKDAITNEWIADRITDELNYNEIKKANYSSLTRASTSTPAQC